MVKLQNKKGFTLLEAIIIVALISVLMGVSFVAVQRYTRSMTKLKYDGYARELFIAAQNHLSLEESLGYPGFDLDRDSEAKLGCEDVETGEDGEDVEVRYFVVNVNGVVKGGTFADSDGTMLSRMLPFASVDESVRIGGQYILRYQLEEATVRDVFYWEDDGRYPLAYADSDYAALMERNDKNTLMRYGAQGAVVGYYSGKAGELLDTGTAMQSPELSVTNADRLTATVTDPNVGLPFSYELYLIVEGKTSGKKLDPIPLKVDNDRIVKTTENGVTTYTIVLDDITQSGMGFADLGGGLIPGEDITLQVLAEPSGTLAAPAYSATATTNSLFGELETEIEEQEGRLVGQAGISSIRHLENLDNRVSGVNQTGSTLQFNKAKQTADISWTDFAKANNAEHPEKVQIHYGDNSTTEEGCYLPVTPGYALEYDGNPIITTVNDEEVVTRRTISDIKVDAAGDAGLFGTLSSGSKVGDLELVDFTVNGTGNAGALAGTASGTTVTNVAAYNSKENDSATTPTITGGGNVGGLIGSVEAGGGLSGCSASLVVEANGESGNAGGLLGTAENAIINGCYSGGHTNGGAYYDGLIRDSETGEIYTNDIINVKAPDSVGGLIGDAGSSVIKNSYSTCSVEGETVGGLVGSTSGTIDTCYSTGLVRGSSTDATVGVFAGSSTATCTGCACLDIASYYDASYDPEEALHAIGSGTSGGITAMDESLETYVNWTPQTAPASPYDSTLETDYAGFYAFKSVAQLDNTAQFRDSHIGDWPSPEQLVVNN